MSLFQEPSSRSWRRGTCNTLWAASIGGWRCLGFEMDYNVPMSEGESAPIPEVAPAVPVSDGAPSAPVPDMPPETSGSAQPEQAPTSPEHTPPPVPPESLAVSESIASPEQVAVTPAQVPGSAASEVSPPTPVPSVSPPAPHFGRYSIAQAQEMSRRVKDAVFRKKAAKILALVARRGSVTKDQVARLLYVSGNSAYLYLKRLVTEGALRRVGHGNATQYEKVRE